MMRIKIDECGYETYESIHDAINSFQHNIALENARLDLDIALLLDADVSPFSNYGMESIKEVSESMKNSVTHSFIPLTKRFINQYFASILKYLNNGTNIQNVLSKSLNDAKNILKSLNEVESFVKSNDASKLVITVYSTYTVVAKGLLWIQLNIQSLITLGKMFHDASSDGYKNASPVQVSERIAETIEKLVKTLYEISKYEDDQKNFKHTLKALHNVNYDVSKLFGYGEISSSNDSKENTSDKINYADVIQKLKRNMVITDEIPKDQMFAPEAWDIIRNELMMFIRLVESNKWNFNKYVKGAETTRRRLLEHINSSIEKDNKISKEESAKAIEQILSLGKTLNGIHTDTNNIFKMIDTGIKHMLNDGRKFVSEIKKYNINNDKSTDK